MISYEFFERFPELVADLEAVDALLSRRVSSQVPLVNQIVVHVIRAGGKRIRPLLLLAAARTCQYAHSSNHHHLMGAVIELIHTATLLHDDVVDESTLRRGQETTHRVFGNSASILAGDFLYSRAFQMVLEVQNTRILQVLAHATNLLAEGEMQQLSYRLNPNIEEAHYLQVIQNKTAKLFEAAVRIGAMLGNAPPLLEQAMAEFGRKTGMAFQLMDDVLDYSGDTELTGKQVADDLRDGTLTLPLIHVLRKGSEREKALVQTSIRTGTVVAFEEIMQAIVRTAALEYVQSQAVQQSEQACQALQAVLPGHSPGLDCLLQLSRCAVQRGG